MRSIPFRADCHPDRSRGGTTANSGQCIFKTEPENEINVSSSKALNICNNRILLWGGFVYFFCLKIIIKTDEQNKLFEKRRSAEAQTSEDDSQDWIVITINSINLFCNFLCHSFFSSFIAGYLLNREKSSPCWQMTTTTALEDSQAVP